MRPQYVIENVVNYIKKWEICKMVAFEQNEIIKKIPSSNIFNIFVIDDIALLMSFLGHFTLGILILSFYFATQWLRHIPSSVWANVFMLLSLFIHQVLTSCVWSWFKKIAYSFENHKGFWTNSTSMSQSNSFIVFLWHEVNCHHYGGNDWS